MTCKQLSECVNKLENEEPKTPSGKKKLKGKRNTVVTIKKTPQFKGYPCGDEARMSCCVSYLDTRSKASCSEKGKTYTLDQSGINAQVLCMHIDGGVVNEAFQQRCDYAFFVKDRVDQGCGRAILVELKGSNINTALKQMSDTLDMPEVVALKNDFKKIYGRVICTSCVPRIQNTSAHMDLKVKLRQFGGNLKIKEWNFVEQYGQLDT